MWWIQKFLGRGPSSQGLRTQEGWRGDRVGAGRSHTARGPQERGAAPSGMAMSTKCSTYMLMFDLGLEGWVTFLFPPQLVVMFSSCREERIQHPKAVALPFSLLPLSVHFKYSPNYFFCNKIPILLALLNILWTFYKAADYLSVILHGCAKLLGGKWYSYYGAFTLFLGELWTHKSIVNI